MKRRQADEQDMLIWDTEIRRLGGDRIQGTRRQNGPNTARAPADEPALNANARQMAGQNS